VNPRWRLCLFVLFTFATACEDEAPPPDDSHPDAAERPDALPDASEPSDAGVPGDGGGRPATHLWGFDYKVPAIVRVRLDDHSREEMVHFDAPCGPDQCPSYDLDAVNGVVYYSDLQLTGARRRNIESGDDELVWTAPGGIFGMQSSPAENALYVVVRDVPATKTDVATLYRVDLSTQNAEVILESSTPTWRIDTRRGWFWEQRTDGALWRTRLSDKAVTRVIGGRFEPLSEFNLGPNGSLLTIPANAPTIELRNHEGRAPQILVEDAQGDSLIQFGITADPASEQIIWFRLLETEPDPEMHYRENANSTSRVLDIPFIYDLRFDSVPNATPPDPSENGAPRPAGTLLFQPCADDPRIECAELVVPIDHENPGGDTATLPVRRRKAHRDDARIGVITFDYGGPSASFLGQFMREKFDDGLAGSGVSLVERFDFVGFERRGIAPATPRFNCVPQPPFIPRNMDEDDWTEMLAWWSQAQADCADHPLIDHLSSRDVAADVEALRIALGEEKINMMTWSYGTTVGATYASHYPDSVRAIALISPTRPEQDSEDRIRIRTALEDQSFHDFFRWCALQPDFCVLGNGAGSTLEVKMRFDEVLADLDMFPIRVGNVLFGRESVLSLLSANSWFACNTWKIHGSILGAAYNGDRAPLTSVLSQRFIPGDSAMALGLGDWTDSGFGEMSIFLGVHGADRPFTNISDPADVRALAEEMSLAHEYAGHHLAITTGTLVNWPAMNPPGLQIRATTAPPMLVVAARFDYATNYEFGQEMVDILANGSRLLTFDGHSHSAAGFDSCSGSAVVDYFIDPARAPTVSSCAEPPVERWPW
jgi:pimeloyl-ACP methyl ester carboxylesterase